MDFKKLQAMTNTQLVRRYEALSKRASKLNDWFVANGFGEMRPLEMRKRRGENPKFGKYTDLLFELADIKGEAARRYGPDLLYVEQLKFVKVKRSKSI